MELRHLRYFRAVAESLSFSRAAEMLRVAQPALSRQIRDLEDEIGVRLLDRNRVRVQLTDAGRVFLEHVTRILFHVDAAVTAAQETARGHDGRLVVCSDWRLSLHLVPEAIVAFRERHPRIDIALAELRVHEQIPALRAGRVHLGFVPRDHVGARHDLELLTVVRSEIVALLPAGHRLAALDSLRLAGMKRETFLLIEESNAPGFRNAVTHVCRLAGFTPDFGQAANTLPGLVAMVASGCGVAVVPRFLAPAADPLVRCVPTDCEPFEMCAVWRRDDSSKLLQQFLEVLRERVPPGTEPPPPS